MRVDLAGHPLAVAGGNSGELLPREFIRVSEKRQGRRRVNAGV